MPHNESLKYQSGTKRKEEVLNMNYVLAPSMLAADFKCLGQQLRMTEENGAKYLHFDGKAN